MSEQALLSCSNMNVLLNRTAALARRSRRGWSMRRRFCVGAPRPGGRGGGDPIRDCRVAGSDASTCFPQNYHKLQSPSKIVIFSSALENVRATLHWTSALPLSYRFHLVSNYPNSSLDVSKSVPFARSAQVILILDVPLFADRLSYTLSGLVTFQQNDKKLTLKFPSSIQLYPHDANDNSIMVHLSAVIDGNNNDLLALALGSEEHEFVMVLPDNSTRLLESTLEIDCVLCRINLKSNRKLFLAHNICPALDGALLEAKDDSDKIVHLNLYCKNIEVVTALLHHLHKHIDGVVIVPKPLYRPDLNFTEITDLVRTSLSREFDELEKRSNTDLGKLRDGMMPLEHETDVLVVRMNQKPDS